MAVRCPDTEKLQALLECDDTVRAGDSVREHLEQCADCRHKLESLAGDATVWEDTAAGLSETVWNEAALKELMERLRSEETPLHEEDVASLLGASDKPGVIGVLGGYDVHEILGRGSMAVVFRASDARLNDRVALKVMLPRLASSETARVRFLREARLAAVVDHENVVRLHQVGIDAGTPFMAMQYVAGESLQDRLDRLGALDLRDIVRFGLQTASALAAAHRKGMVHRDIKPANIMLSGETDPPKVIVTDFGLARHIDDSLLTKQDTIIGTPEYMSPEQARGEALDARSDLFSLGSVLYAMCTGKSPFRGGTAVAVLRKVCDDKPTPVRTLNPSVPEWLATLIERLLAKNPADRIASAAEVAELLQGYLAHLQTSAPAPALAKLRATWNHRLRVRLAVLLTTCVFLLAIFAALVVRNAHWLDWRLPAAGFAALLCATGIGGYLIWRRSARIDARDAAPKDSPALRRLQCDACTKEFDVMTSFSGRTVRCPKCGKTLPAPNVPAPM
jgi:tRNA A-37 threonylcarbamoyl transferase component Bud32